MHMRIGVVSDTHNQLGNVERIVELFNAAGVARVVHTGDITQAKTLAALSQLRMPLHGVYGNNDLEREALESAAARFGMHLSDPPLRLQWAGRKITVVHDPLDITPEMPAANNFVLHGHNHRTVLERRENCLVFNPGECAGFVSGANCIGTLDLAAGVAELLRF